MEIKQGDKVRIADNAPSEYRYGFNYRLRTQESEVVEVDDDDYMAAIVPMCVNDKDLWFQIPCKYLIKVDAEAKEAKYKKDDKVCINKSSLKHGLRGEILTIIGVDVSDRTYLVYSSCMRSPIWLRENEISTYTEPTEPTEEEDARIRQIEAELDEFRKSKLYKMWCCEKPNFEATIDNAAMNWQRYEADLAKEVALKVANKHMDSKPEDVGAYAVQVAKAVVEGLKRERV